MVRLANASDLRDAVRVLQKIFKFATCKIEMREGDPKLRHFRPCLLHAIRRVARDEGLPSIVVEQHPHLVLGVTDDAMVLDRGGVAYRATSTDLLRDPAPLDTWLGVAR